MIRGWIFLVLILFAGAIQGQVQSLEHLLKDYDTWKKDQPPSEQLKRLWAISIQSELLNDPETKANTLRRIGVLYMDLGYLDSAQDVFIQSLRIQEVSGNKAGLVSTYNNLSGVYYYLGQKEKALSSFLETGNLAEELSGKDPFYADLAIPAFTNVAQLYYENDSFQAARYYLDKVEALQLKYDRDPVGYTDNLSGLIYLNQREFIQAIEAFTKAKSLFYQNKDTEGAVQCLHNLALCYSGLKEKTSARIHFELALDSAMILENPFLISELAHDMQQYYLDNGDTLHAFHYLSLAKRFDDSLLNEAGVQALIEAEQKYANESKTREIAVQKEELQQRYILIICLISLLLTLILAFILFRRLSIQKRKLDQAKIREQSSRIDELFRKQEISSLSAQMAGQNEERQRISRELHDRLGSLLSTIKLQFSHFEGRLQNIEEQFRDSYTGMLGMLDKAYDEVRRISHDLSSGTLEKFGLKGAINELIDAITEVSTVKIHFIDNKTDPSLYNHLNEQVYRIIQELLSNTLKHARAREINLQIHCSNGIFYLSYEDDGKGMDESTLQSSKGIGMRNIESRVSLMNGTWNVDSTPGHGFTFMMEIPL
ncbi:MAG: tetratricopeptide repeat protein [Bacteroidetes bacterium]|nr:tetratricopeptide repeat protein [Bacteroidota bacterium]